MIMNRSITQGLNNGISELIFDLVEFAIFGVRMSSVGHDHKGYLPLFVDPTHDAG